MSAGDARGGTARASPALPSLSLVAVLVPLVACAWLSLVLLGSSPYQRYLAHDSAAAGLDPAALPLYVAGWTLMTVAVMLPTSLPLVVLFERAVRDHPDRLWQVLVLVAGYVAVWAGVGGAFFAADTQIHAVVEATPWLAAHPAAIPAATFVVAGALQFTGLKDRCLARCRTPRLYLVAHWHGRPYPRALRLGAAHGVFCVGCCWGLMLIMFAVGHSSIGWMVLLGAVMALEKNASWGAALTRPIGAALIAEGVVIAALAG